MPGGLYNPRPVDDIPVNGQLAHGVTSNRMFDHEAALAAHTRDIWQIKRTGEYYLSPLVSGRLHNARALVADTLYAMPYPIIRDETEDRIAVQVTVQAGEKIRMGIYANGTNLYPGTLLDDSGEITLAGVGIQAITISEALTKGLPWVVIVTDGTPTVYNAEDYFAGLLGIQAAGFNQLNTRWTVAHTYAALPDPFPAGGTSGFYPAPAIALRLLTND